MRFRLANQGKTISHQDYSKRIIFSSNAFKAKGHLLQVVTIPPKTKQRVHYHLKQTEVFYILEGKANLYINEKKFLTKPGDSFICEPHDKHNLWNKSNKDFKLIVFKINLPKEDDIKWCE